MQASFRPSVDHFLYPCFQQLLFSNIFLCNLTTSTSICTYVSTFYVFAYQKQQLEFFLFYVCFRSWKKLRNPKLTGGFHVAVFEESNRVFTHGQFLSTNFERAKTVLNGIFWNNFAVTSKEASNNFFRRDQSDADVGAAQAFMTENLQKIVKLIQLFFRCVFILRRQQIFSPEKL